MPIDILNSYAKSKTMYLILEITINYASSKSPQIYRLNNINQKIVEYYTVKTKKTNQQTNNKAEKMRF